MPALKPTELTASVVWLGVVDDRDATLSASAVTSMELGFGGLLGEEHAGLTRPSCSRVASQHPRGTEIANVRQLSIVSAEDLQAVADQMGVAQVNPAWIGASVMVEGIADFTLLPPSSRLQAENGTTLVIDMENRPCHLPAKPIDADLPGKGGLFKAAAKHRRGVTAWVERPGVLSLGDQLRLHIPDQPVWPHLVSVRG